MRAVVEGKNLTQAQVVELIGKYDATAGIGQPDVSRILRGNVKGYSEWRLLMILAALGNKVSIIVEPSRGQGSIGVHKRAAA